MKNTKRNFNPISLKYILKSFISQKSLQKGMTNVRVCNAWKDVSGRRMFLSIPPRLDFLEKHLSL